MGQYQDGWNTNQKSLFHVLKVLLTNFSFLADSLTPPIPTPSPPDPP